MELGIENGATYKDEKGLEWGKSLPVPSVQELVRKDPSSVPERYIRERAERPKDRGVSAITPDVPVIDFSLLSSGDEDERKRLDLASKEWGFFQITNHGVQEDILCRIRKAMGGFFNLSYEEKKKYAMAPNDLHGYGQPFVMSEEQKLDWNDLLFIVVEPTEQRQMKYWPTIVPDFKPDDVFGVSPHSDGSSITILLQEDDNPGLKNSGVANNDASTLKIANC